MFVATQPIPQPPSRPPHLPSQVRNLHLGHVAHAFCLTETPTLVGSSGSAADRKRRKREQSAAAEADRRKKMKRAARKVSA